MADDPLNPDQQPQDPLNPDQQPAAPAVKSLLDLWGNAPPPPNWQTTGFFDPGQPSAGGTQYADEAAYRLGDWQAHLGARAQSALMALPQDWLDANFPVDRGPSGIRPDDPATAEWRAGGSQGLPPGATTTSSGVPVGPDGNPVLPEHTASGGGFNFSEGVAGLHGPGYGNPSQGDPLGGWYTLQGLRGALNAQGQAGPPSFQMYDAGPSTDNWRLLPPSYRSPQFKMRGGHIINKIEEASPGLYVTRRGTELLPNISQLGSGGGGYPLSVGSGVSRGYFWPGQVEGWVYEGGPGIT